MEHEKQTRECSKQNEFQQQQTRHEVHVNISTHRKTAKILEVAALTVALTATVTLFSLPIIFHFVIKTTSADNSSVNSTNSSFSFDNALCTELNWSTQSLSDTTIIDQCTSTYSEAICTPYLKEWYMCAISPTGDGDVVINETIDRPQTMINDEITNLLSLLESYPECKQAALPFLCQYYFPLKECSKRNVYTATREDCLSLSETVCKIPWQIAVAIGYGDQLPVCGSLLLSTNSSTDAVSNININNTASINITCRSDFDLINETCLPRCDKFDSHSAAATITLLSSEIIAVTTGLCVCLLIIAFTIPNYKNMMTVPSVFLLFLTANYIGAAIVVIVSAVDRTGLYCRSQNLIESLQSSTVFCSISGAVFHYVLVSMTVWWFLHVAVFFYKVIFPFHAQQLQKDKRNKYLYIVMIIIGAVIPLLAVIVTLCTDGYHVSRFPPSICSPGGTIFFYSVTIVIDVLIGTGVCFLIIIFWIIHTNQTFRHMNRDQKRLTTAEKKIMVVFMSFIIFGVYTMIQAGIVSAHSDKLIDGLRKYLTCEFTGHVPGKCDRNDFEKYSYPYLLAVSYILLGLIPLSILNFVVNVRLTKAFVRKYLKTGREIDSVGISFQTTSTSASGNVSTSTFASGNASTSMSTSGNASRFEHKSESEDDL